jgi:hypothetical protein
MTDLESPKKYPLGVCTCSHCISLQREKFKKQLIVLFFLSVVLILEILKIIQ